MGSPAGIMVELGAAALTLGSALAAALARALHHRRRSRVARYVSAPAVSIREGLALLRGVVEAEDDAPGGPVLALDLPSGAPALYPGPVAPPSAEARTFSLRLPSGALVRVEAEEGRWTLDTTFTPGYRGGAPRYAAEVLPGEALYVAGSVQSEIDPRAAGKGYRDAARAWVVRAPARAALAFSSAAAICQHVTRARFHAGWALVLGAELGAGAGYAFAVSVSGGGGALALLLACATVFTYWSRAEETSPWVDREVRRSGAVSD